MGQFNEKIYRLIAINAVFLLLLSTTLLAKDDVDAILYKIKLPIYQKGKSSPTAILFAKKAQPIGIRFELKGVRVVWYGLTLKDIKGVITTESAVYDKTTQHITGNDIIRYRSDQIDIDGVGFDIDQVKQTIRLRSQVKVVLRRKVDLKHKVNKVEQKTIKDLKDSGATTIDIERLKSISMLANSSNNNNNNEIKKGEKKESGWSMWLWFILMIILSLTAIIFLIVRKKQKDSGTKILPDQNNDNPLN